MRSDFDETNGASAAGDSTFAPFIENTNPSMSTGSLNIVMPDKNKDTRMSPNPNRGKKIVGAIVGTCAVAAIVGCGFAYANGLFGQQAQPAARPTVTTTTVQEAKHETAPEPAPIAQSGMITITLRAEGLTGEGSRIPLHVKGVRLDAVPYTQDIFASAGESKLNLPAGSYSLSVVGSPISAEGVVYSIPTEAIQVDISEDGTVTCDPMDTHFELKPVEAADVTDAQIEEARSWVAKDPDNASKAEKLANLAQQRRKNASISGSQSNSRDTDHASESHEATQNDNSNYTATDSTESNSPSYYVPTQT